MNRQHILPVTREQISAIVKHINDQQRFTPLHEAYDPVRDLCETEALIKFVKELTGTDLSGLSPGTEIKPEVK